VGLEDHGKLPAELQKRVHQEVEQTKSRSGWPVRTTLAALGIARRSYYRWLKEEAWARDRPVEPPVPVSPYEALLEEKQAVITYARKHPELRHRELAWRMVDEDVAYVSPSTVYRVLKEANLVCPWRRRAKRKRALEERATRADERWSTDLMHIQVGGRVYYYAAFLDEYSRYIVHHELLLGMDGLTVSTAAQKAIETLPRGPDGRPIRTPEIRSDNGSCYIAKEFRVVLEENGLGHHRIQPHCPEENGLMERANRTIRESLEGEDLSDLVTAERVLARLVGRYNVERLHSALGYLPPWESYRGNPAKRFEERRVKLFQARHRRRERNLRLRQGTLPLEGREAVP
jgi:transposase InsO family protein